MEPYNMSVLEAQFISVEKLMPSAIPLEFYSQDNLYVKFVSKWFYEGQNAKLLVVKSHINRSLALRHCAAIMESFDLAHEHKFAAVAYLISEWFDITPVTKLDKVNSPERRNKKRKKHHPQINRY